MTFSIFKKERKEYCGLLGGLTFYRTCHICKSWGEKGEKNMTKTFPFLHRTCTNTILYRMDPLRGLGTNPSSYITLFWYTLLGGFLFLVLWRLFPGWTCLLHGRKQGRFWSRDAWCRLCVLTHVGSCVPNFQAKSDKTTFTGRHCGCLLTSSCLLFVVYTKMHWIKCLY